MAPLRRLSRLPKAANARIPRSRDGSLGRFVCCRCPRCAEYAAELIERAKAPLDNVRTEQSEELAESADFLTKTAMRQIELRHKRALTQATRTSLKQMTAIIRSWLRDVLMVVSGTPELMVNIDQRSAVEAAAARVNVEGLMRALRESVQDRRSA